MDDRVTKRLSAWYDHLDSLKTLEDAYFTLEADEKSLLARITMDQEGKSHAERETKALASTDWKVFRRGLSAAKGEYLHAKRLLDWKIKAYEAEYYRWKTENEAIKRAS